MMGYKAAMQVLKKADLLKIKVTRQSDLLNDLEAWTDQQQLQTIYHQVLVLDLEYALDKKVEQELWTLGFKNHISKLQEQSRDKKNPRRSESQALLSWCLEAASGFYLTLLQELCSTYELDLPFRKSVIPFGKLKTGNYNEPTTLPQSSSCLYICQYCLVHLGDIARYRNQRKQAESFYRHAILVSPYSGHPYNQLALLEASEGDRLSTVFHYVRGIAVKNPFPAAATNLGNTLAAAIDKDEPLMEIQSKMSVNEFISLFLKAHALLHTDTDLNQAELCVKSITAALTALVATQSFTTETLIKMTVINMYALKHTAGDKIMKVDELTDDERKVRELVLDLLAGSLSAFLLPVYTLKGDESLLGYYALPAIRLILMWIRKDPLVLTDNVFTSRLQIWPGFCKLLNILQNYIKQDDYQKYVTIPLHYDRELRGFTPLKETFTIFDFTSELSDPDMEKHIRADRLTQFGKWLTTYNVNGSKLIICSEEENKLQFEPACIQPDPTDQLLEEMKSFKVTDEVKRPERRGGILKPQGSLEKSREERVLQEDIQVTHIKMDPNKYKRVTQNVALQSIYKKIEESKQVKFSAETTDKEKSPKTKPPPIQHQPVSQPQPSSNPQFRTLAFPQNLPHVPIDKPPTDFFNYPKPFPSNDLLNLSSINKLPQNMQFTVPPPNIYNQPPPPPPAQHSSNFTPLIEKPINFNLPPNYNFNKDEPRPANWWPNQIVPPNTNYPQQDIYRYNQFGSNVNDAFNSPWNNVQSPRSSATSFGNTNSVSIRQAMLNETKHLAGSTSNSNLVNNAPGYSLFNTTSWSPALPGQLRNNGNGELQRQQSLYTAAAPQSLQQLLEQQNQLQKGDT